MQWHTLYKNDFGVGSNFWLHPFEVRHQEASIFRSHIRTEREPDPLQDVPTPASMTREAFEAQVEEEMAFDWDGEYVEEGEEE